ncbi:MAG: protein-methionine-sulfoxide reductase catalytic subunit MsrP [Paracoccaceae bacterium]
MSGRWKNDLKWSQVTPRAAYMNRRQLLASAVPMAIAGPVAAVSIQTVPSKYSTDMEPNSYEDITTYNNFYEFGTGKGDPAKYAHALTVDPWSVKIDGLVDRPGNYDLADLLQGVTMEERIYRLRCVEGWSAVIPWVGFELKTLLDRVGAQPSAKYVAFETLLRPEEMFAQRRKLLNWPYVEGLRMDEAMHPLTILATGLYGQDLPNQNGAPFRLVVPWKYGFKSIKSIVRISLVADEPLNTWQQANAREYGFFSNVNPNVDHPRWSQATERPIGGGLFSKRVPTLMFNGYGDQVASMYAGMDLQKFY